MSKHPSLRSPPTSTTTTTQPNPPPPATTPEPSQLLPSPPGLQAESILLNNNTLEGPAFPSAWLAPKAFPSLKALDLDRMPRLTGTLPANLPWPSLASL